MTPDQRTALLDDLEDVFLDPKGSVEADSDDDVFFIAVIEVIKKHLKPEDIWPQ